MSELTSLATVLQEELKLNRGGSTQAAEATQEAQEAQKEYALAEELKEQVDMLLAMDLLTAQEVSEIRQLSLKVLQAAKLENILRAKRNKAELEEKYGVTLTMEEYYGLSKALADIDECRACADKRCGKSKEKYWQAKVQIAGGKALIGRERCARWHYQVNEQCEKAGIPYEYLGKGFGDYEETQENRDALAMARWYVKEYPRRWLYYYGGVGAGKTLLVSIIARELICAGKQVIFGDVPSLLRKIKERFDAKDDKGVTAQAVQERYMQVPVLVLDDIGAGYQTAWSVGILYEIINHRYNKGLRTIITSNYELREAKSATSLTKRLNATGADFEGTRIVSRIIGMSEEGYFGTHDRRRESRRHA